MKNPLSFTFMKKILTFMFIMLPSVLRHNDEFKSNYELDGQLAKARENFDIDPKDFAPFIFNFLPHKEVDGIFSVDAPYTFNLNEVLSPNELQMYQRKGPCERLSYEEIQIVNKLMTVIKKGMKRIGLDINTELVEHPHPKEQILVFGNCPTLTTSFEHKKGYLAFINLNYMLETPSKYGINFVTQVFFRHVVDHYILGAPNLTEDDNSRLIRTEAGVKLQDDILDKLYKLHKNRKKPHCVGTLPFVQWGRGYWNLKECGFPNPLNVILLHAAYDNKYAPTRKIGYVVDPSPRATPTTPPTPIISTKTSTTISETTIATTITTTNHSNSNFVFFTKIQGLKKNQGQLASLKSDATKLNAYKLEESSKVVEYEFGEEPKPPATFDHEFEEGLDFGF